MFCFLSFYFKGIIFSMERLDIPQTGEILLWDNLSELMMLIERIDYVFRKFPENFKTSMMLAKEVKNCLKEIDSFIDFYSKRVCSNCKNICCLNKNSRYEYDDLIYILALREKFPLPHRNLRENEPCYLLTEYGCKIPRYLRPLRCNWYICKDLFLEMESAPAKIFREFSNTFNKMLQIRMQMLNSFFQSLSYIESNI